MQLTGRSVQLSTLQPSDPTTFNGRLYFAAGATSGALALWRSDGTAAGTTLVKNIYTNFGDASISEFTEVKRELYFIANYYGLTLGVRNGIYNGSLWKTDGTNAGTTQVAFLSSSDTHAAHIGTLGNRVLFWVNSSVSTHEKLEITDGTSITVLADFVHGSQNSDFGELNGKAFFSIDDGTHGAALWQNDGTVSGTMLGNANVVGAANFTVSNGHLYFTANGGSGVELFSTDGNTLGAYNITAGSASSNPGNLTDVNGSLYFSADDGNHGRELWKVNRSGAASIVKDINPGSGSSSPSNLVNGGGLLFFEANDGTGEGLASAATARPPARSSSRRMSIFPQTSRLTSAVFHRWC